MNPPTKESPAPFVSTRRSFDIFGTSTVWTSASLLSVCPMAMITGSQPTVTIETLYLFMFAFLLLAMCLAAPTLSSGSRLYILAYAEASSSLQNTKSACSIANFTSSE